MSWIIDLFRDIPLTVEFTERLSIADTRINNLEKGNALLDQQLQHMKNRVLQLEHEITVLRDENQRLEVGSYKTQELPQKLEGIREQLLIIVWCSRDQQAYCSTEDIEKWLNYLQDMDDHPHYDRHLIDHYLSELVNQRILEPVEEGIDKGKGYKLKEAGSEYFINNNLQNTDSYRYLREAHS
jgi:hypothetical protein